MKIIEVRGLCNWLDGRFLHQDLNFEVEKGEIVAIVGGSGCGKTTLLRTILMLLKPTAGNIKVFGIDLNHCSRAQALAVQKRWGVMFQKGALFRSLTVLENIMFPMHEHTTLTAPEQREVALLKIALVGLKLEVAYQYPAELSGGMEKRVALARAIALDPELLFLDEPTSGLDPNSAGALEDLILDLRDNLGLTFVMVTHDIATLQHVPDRIAFLAEGKVLALMPINELMQQSHPAIRAYFTSRNSNLKIHQELLRDG